MSDTGEFTLFTIPALKIDGRPINPGVDVEVTLYGQTAAGPPEPGPYGEASTRELRINDWSGPRPSRYREPDHNEVTLTFCLAEPVTPDHLATRVAEACSKFYALRVGEGVLMPSDPNKRLLVSDEPTPSPFQTPPPEPTRPFDAGAPDERVSVMARALRTPGSPHTRVSIFAGPDPGHRANCGFLTFRNEAGEFLRILASGGAEIEEG